MRPIIIAINGILTRQAVVSWPDQFDAWMERGGTSSTSPQPKVLKKEYCAGPFPLYNVHVKNRILASGIAAEVALLCDQAELGGTSSTSPQPALHFVSHSNGTDIALKAIKKLAARGIQTETFIAVGSVLHPDIADNGVLDLLEEGDLKRAVCYCSASDLALRFGRHTLGYSDLGRCGWRLNGVDVNEILKFSPPLIGGTSPQSSDRPQCFSRSFDGFGHGDYFTTHRAATFELFRKDMGL